MSVIQVGIIDTTSKLDQELVQSAAAALNLQVIKDLPQFWNIQATVSYLPDAGKIPPGVWPVKLVPKLPPGEGGVHMDKHNQPYSLVIANPGSDEWTIDASHETLEMLVDPYGNRLQSAHAIAIDPNGTITDNAGEFSYLVEACDPCEADNYAYSIQGVAVSDFITPHFYDPTPTPGVRYSFTGAIQAPRRLLPGGYISYVDLATNEWQQILWIDPNQKPIVRDLGPAPAGQSLRVWVDAQMEAYKQKIRHKRALNPALLDRCRKRRTELSRIASLRAKLYT
ncbi:MAG TPA: hypothetical protein VMU04_11500 [Candidatus Acidoferrum sp.]|nr:hypothetical protein [Candidatus Acidoferrum sp.]